MWYAPGAANESMAWRNGVAVRETCVRARADDWALVLASAGIECAVSHASGAWRVEVDAADLAQARCALDAYDREQQEPEKDEPPLPDWGPTQMGFAIGLLLLLFHAVAGDNAQWSRLGSAAGQRILAGEWWRTVTAVTLHANLAHVAGNAIAGALFLTAVFRLVGPGVGLWLVLLAGAGANAINAAIRPTSHTSVGASSAVFAGVGILSAYQFLRHRQVGRPRGRDWIPLAAGLALLGWLGAGPNSDVTGHLLGFLIGSVLGVLLGLRVSDPLPRHVQFGLVMAGALFVAGCWLLAMRLGSPWP